MLLDGQWTGAFEKGVPKTWRDKLHTDEHVARTRKPPGMPKLRFMDGTKWGVDPLREPRAMAA